MATPSFNEYITSTEQTKSLTLSGPISTEMQYYFYIRWLWQNGHQKASASELLVQLQIINNLFIEHSNKLPLVFLVDGKWKQARFVRNASGKLEPKFDNNDPIILNIDKSELGPKVREIKQKLTNRNSELKNFWRRNKPDFNLGLPPAPVIAIGGLFGFIASGLVVSYAIQTTTVIAASAIIVSTFIAPTVLLLGIGALSMACTWAYNHFAQPMRQQLELQAQVELNQEIKDIILPKKQIPEYFSDMYSKVVKATTLSLYETKYPKDVMSEKPDDSDEVDLGILERNLAPKRY